MPIYRYRCTTPKAEDNHVTKVACGNEYEVFYLSVSKVSDEEPKEACPACGGTEKERLISQGTSHILKGKGWYKDGY